jgi:hypothetical protein
MHGSNNREYKRWAWHVMVEPSEIQKQVMQQYIQQIRSYIYVYIASEEKQKEKRNHIYTYNIYMARTMVALGSCCT